MRRGVPCLIGSWLLLLGLRASASETLISGTVHAVHAGAGFVRLEFEDPQTPPVILLVGWLTDFPSSPEQYYLGKSVAARGSLRSFRSVPEVHVRDAGDITVVSSASGTEGPASGDTVEIDRLREEVRKLQQRVRELERHGSDHGQPDD